MVITKEMLEQDIPELEKQLEAIKAEGAKRIELVRDEAIHRVGEAEGRLNTVRAQITYLEAEAKKSDNANTAEDDVRDQHPEHYAKVAGHGQTP